MIGALRTVRDNLLGIGEAAVTVPPLDGAFRPDPLLDAAQWRRSLAEVDCLATVSGRIVASAGRSLYRLDGNDWQFWRRFEGDIAAITPLDGEALVIALVTGEIIIEGGAHDGRRLGLDIALHCITDMVAGKGAIFIANGSARHGPADWARDLMERGASGSLWRVDLTSGKGERIADGLAYPAGMALLGDELVLSEAWKHRLVILDKNGGGDLRAVLSDLPAYPGRLSSASDGFWLAAFAPRSQLVEFVLREPAYCRRMIAEVAPDHWIAPRLRSGKSFHEPLQGGAVKHLGIFKPWAPAFSAGLCVRLDRRLQPRRSLHSRADGATHGVTSVAEYQGRLFVAARGDGVVVSVPLHELEGL